MTVYKLQIWLGVTEDIGDMGEFRDLYFDVEKISGFYIPDDIEEMLPEKAINVFFEGDFMTIKQEPHILKYLRDKFGKAIIN